jgi:ATP phosphoribosyltransferase regulatory subunit
MRKWVLPEYVDDILPAEAERIEALRRRLLDHFRGHGYRLVQPPLIEHLESLLTGTGHDLELQTFKLVDPLSGRLLGVRADITPQVARIDAHLLNEPGVTRLCYAGSVLRTVASGVAQSREVLQIGAELYGDPDIGADQEVLGLLLSALDAVEMRGLHLDLAHVGIYRALAQAAGIAGNGSDSDLFTAIRTKDRSAVAEITDKLPAAWREAFLTLPMLYGPAEDVLAAARARLPDTASIARALAALATLAKAVSARVESLAIDLADLRGYHYQTGASFSVFIAGEPNAIGRGERYDGIGKAFGRARPATGFTLDLRQLARLG